MRNLGTNLALDGVRRAGRRLGAALLALAVGLGVLSSVSAASFAHVTDPKDMADRSGDIRSISAYVLGSELHLEMTVEGPAAPSVAQTAEGMNNRYYYHWLLDTDNNPATGRSNSEYEGTPTGVVKPVGADRIVMIGWRDGLRGGVEMWNPADENVMIRTNFPFQVGGNTLTAIIPLADLGLAPGQTIAVSAFQEGSSDGWAVDWMESATLTLEGPALAQGVVTDPNDLGDSSGNIREVAAHVMGDNLQLRMTVEGTMAPSVEQTPVDKVNRYYYHFLLDTDNNPATGRSNAEYEGTPTGLTKPVGADRVIMVGWRDGLPGGIEMYDPANEDLALATNFTYQASGNTLTVVLPLADLGLSPGQTIAVSAFQEGASDGWAVDWMEPAVVTLSGPKVPVAVVSDPQDMADSSGDIRKIRASVLGDSLELWMTVEKVAAPSTNQTPVDMNNRYYYHWLLDTDNNPATGRSNAEYEGTPTGVTKPVGADRVIMIGWRDGLQGGVELYDPANEDVAIATNFTFLASGNSIRCLIPLADIGLSVGQTIAVSAFQEGSSDGWAVDWIESATVTLEPPSVEKMKIDGQFQDWADAAAAGGVGAVADGQDLADSSGDIRKIEATVEAGYLYLRMSVQGVALPSVDQTPEGKVNRYYYHWLLDTDNNPATGRSNAEYEGTPTGVTKPVGADRVIMIGWRDGAQNGLEAYDPANEANPILTNFTYKASGDSVEARFKLSDLGLALGQQIAISAFQEGASDGWAVDWIESTVVTLSEDWGSGMTLDTLFSGDAYGFSIQIQDAANQVVDAATVVTRLDGQIVPAMATKAGGVTTVIGKHGALLAAGTAHKVGLSLKASGTAQAKEFVFTVEPYTALPLEGSFVAVDKTKPGFVIKMTQITDLQIGASPPITSLHSNIASLAEMQVAGLMKEPVSGTQCYNEAELDGIWIVRPVVEPTTINWFELAPDQVALLNFTNDVPVPKVSGLGFPVVGVAAEILTYVELPEGYHKLGLFTEGGHKVTAGLTASNVVLSLFDNSTTVSVPTYFARSQFFNVVATEAGYYPIRFLWFQDRHDQEQGMMLEIFSVADRGLHLLNDTSDPKALRVYRAGALSGGTGSVTTPVSATVQAGGQLRVQYTGMLQWAASINGPWFDYADSTQSPVTLTTGDGVRFFRARSY